MKLRQLRISPILPLSVGRFPTCSVQGSRQLGPDPLERQGAWEWGGSLTGSWHLPLVAAVTQPHPCCLPEQPGAVVCSRSTTYTNTVNGTLSTISAFVLIVNKSKNVPLNNRSLQTSEIGTMKNQHTWIMAYIPVWLHHDWVMVQTPHSTKNMPFRRQSLQLINKVFNNETKHSST